jgi:hypothetical protein
LSGQPAVGYGDRKERRARAAALDWEQQESPFSNPPENVERVLESFQHMVWSYPPFPHTLPWINETD